MITKKKYQRGGAGAYKYKPIKGAYRGKNSKQKVTGKGWATVDPAAKTYGTAGFTTKPQSGKFLPANTKQKQNITSASAAKVAATPASAAKVAATANKWEIKNENWKNPNNQPQSYNINYAITVVQPTSINRTAPETVNSRTVVTETLHARHLAGVASHAASASLNQTKNKSWKSLNNLRTARKKKAVNAATKKGNIYFSNAQFVHNVNMPEGIWATTGLGPRSLGAYLQRGNTPTQPLARAALNRQKQAETLPPGPQQTPAGPEPPNTPSNTPPPNSNLPKTPAGPTGSTRPGPEPPKPPAGPEPPKTPPTPAEIKQNISYYFFNIHNINYNNPDPKPLQDLSAKMLDTFKDLMILQNKTNQETTNKLLAIIEKQAAGLNLIPQTQSQSQSLPQTQQEEKEKKKKIRGFFDRLYYHIKILFRNEKAALKEFHKKTLKREKAVKDTHRYTRNMKRHRKRTKKATKDAQRAEYFSLASKQYEADRQAAANAATKAAKKAASSNTKASRDAAKAAVKKTKKAINNAASKLMSKTKKAKKAKLILNSLRNKLTGQTNDKQYFDYKLKEIEYELSITPISNKNKRKDLQKKLNYYKNTLTKNIFPISNDNQVNQNFFNP